MATNQQKRYRIEMRYILCAAHTILQPSGRQQESCALISCEPTERTINPDQRRKETARYRSVASTQMGASL